MKKSNNITYNFLLTQNKKIKKKKSHKLILSTVKKLQIRDKLLILNRIPNKSMKNFKNNHNPKLKKLKANLINNHLKVKRPKTNHRHNKRLKKLNKNQNQSPHNTLLKKIFTIPLLESNHKSKKISTLILMIFITLKLVPILLSSNTNKLLKECIYGNSSIP